MDLDRHSLEALDWPFVLEALASRARTEAGAHAARALAPLAGADDVRTVLDAVGEATALRDGEAGAPPVGGVGDVEPDLVRAARGEVLEQERLLAVANTVAALHDVATFLGSRHADAPTLAGWASAIAIDPALRRTLAAAFDAHGELSEKTYPLLGTLRRRIETLDRRARAALEGLLAGSELADVIQDRYVTIRSDRLVVPIKAQAKNLDLGIVHDSSRSGQTVYIEPNRIVPLGNDKRLAEAELAAELRRILAELSSLVGGHRPALHAALLVAVDIDLACARAELARRLYATRPEVGGDSVIALRAARHPVLVLDGVDVVANDLTLDASRPVLVLTGPNAGGKTIALKTIALCAQLVRVGCFVPAAEGSRIDFFSHVVADIGDQQSVHGGVSSFSGHLTNLRAMLDGAGPATLLLLDELASGTDPTQGGALARALLERFADAGARVVTTTHYAQVKGMAAADSRVTVAALEYLDDRPTYRVVPGMAGESHAMSAAARVGIDATLIERARELMDEGERAMQDALTALEQERARSQELSRVAEEARSELAAREKTLAQREARIKHRARQLEEEAAAAFIERVRQAEREIADVVATLQRSPSSKQAADARAAVVASREVLSHAADAGTAPSPVAAADAPIAVGDRVQVARLDVTGEVTALRRGEIEVRAGKLTVRARASEVVRLAGAPAGASVSTRPAARRRSTRGASRREAAEEGFVRVDANTLDLRGERVEEALARLEKFLDDAVLGGHDAVFVLHGHGTGALKAAVRDTLAGSPYVDSSGPADSRQGGDALTIAVLRG